MASSKKSQTKPKAATGVNNAHPNAPTKKRPAPDSPSPSNEKRQSRPTKQAKITSFLVSGGGTSIASGSSWPPNDASDTGDFVNDVCAFILHKDPEPLRSQASKPSCAVAKMGNGTHQSHDSDVVLYSRPGLPVPAELVLEICSHLGPKDVLRLQQTSKRLAETISRYHVLHEQAGRQDRDARFLNTDRLMRWAFAKGGAWHFSAIKAYLRKGGPISDQGGLL